MFDLLDYWETSPPLHVMVAAYLGVDTKRDAGGSHYASEADIADIVAQVSGGR